jgi:2-oxoglutarate dioxygenase / 2-oxoglutarate/L-arginine monooxygenase/decarboxylase
MTDLQTFHLPAFVTGTSADNELALEMMAAWRRDGTFHVAAEGCAAVKTANAFAASKRFFQLPLHAKAECISDLSYSGYIASGEEITAGEADYSETYTVCKDVPLNDTRVQGRWPCHGPSPWPDTCYRDAMGGLMAEFGSAGEKLLRLTALGLGLEIDAFTRLTQDGWHHMRVMRFPTMSSKSARGIGAHTDYGLLVIVAQNEVGGLYVRPPVPGEVRKRNWLPTESSAGMYENVEPWTFVTPVPNVWTVFPGDIMQFMTGGRLLSTPHKVRLATSERYSLAYFHEPNFQACARPLFEASDDHIHYGTHFTKMFARCYPQRITTRRIESENRWSVLQRLKKQALGQCRGFDALDPRVEPPPMLMET